MKEVILSIVLLLLLSSCSKNEYESVLRQNKNNSKLSIHAVIRSPSGSYLSKSLITEWNRIITRVTAADMDTIHDTLQLLGIEPFYQYEIREIPSGLNRKVAIWTENSNNNRRIHFTAETTLTMQPAEMAALSFMLWPCAGTISFQIAEIDAAVDTVWCSFISGIDSFLAVAAKSSRNGVSISLDYIPDGSMGLIAVYGTKTEGTDRDTLYSFRKSIAFNAASDSVLYANFKKTPSGLTVEVSTLRPGSSVIIGNMNTASDATESGLVYISEVMVKNDYEYIEIKNSATNPVTIDSLYLLSNKTSRLFRSVTIQADGFYTIGRTALPGIDTVVTGSLLDLLSAGSEPIVLRSGKETVIDFLYIPKVISDSKSMELKESINGAIDNNFYHNWLPANEEISGFSLFGTPGR